MSTLLPSAPRPRPRSRSSRFREWPRFLALCLLSLLFLAPVYWMISTGFKPEADAIRIPVQWIPQNPTLEHYQAILSAPDENILRWMWNSLFTSAVHTALYVLLCALTAYPLARMRFRGRTFWFWLILSSLMIPGVVTLIPSYIMMIRFSWIDTFHALIWPGLPGVFGVFLLRQFFYALPRELEEAARLDGANSWQILWRILLPLSTPALATLAVFTFLGAWNNYGWAVFVVHGDTQTLPVGLATFLGKYNTTYGRLMAGTTLASVPVVLAYLLAQRYLERGLTLTGLKE